MRRTAPGYVQLPHNHHNAHPQAAGSRPGGPRSPAGGSPLARTSTTASYFEAGEDNGTAASAAQQNGTVGPSGKIVSPDSGGTTSRSSASPARPPNSRTKSNSSIHSVGSLRSAGSSYTASSSSPSGPVPSTATAASHHLPATAHKHYHHQHSNNIPQHQQHSYRYYPGHSPAGSSNSSKTTQADEIEASLRQWRNHVFPSLKAGNYVSPGQEIPERDPIHPLVEPILPSIFQAGAPNAKCRVQSYGSAKDFLAALSEDEVYERSWRLEMVLGQTEDMLYNPAGTEGVWLAVWSGSDEDGSRLLEFCLTKLPSRPLIIISPMPMAVLPTALLQDRMLSLLNAFLSHPTIASASSAPFSLIMGPTRAVEAFLLHFDGIDIDKCVNSGLEKYHNSPIQHRGSWAGAVPPPAYYAKGHRASISSTSSTSIPPPADYPSTTWSPSEASSGAARERSESTGAVATVPQVTTSASSSPVANTKSATFPTAISGGGGQLSSSSFGGIHHASTANGRTVKALLHTRIERPPPSVSLSEGFEVRLANENDDLACLTGLFQAYSATLDHFLDDYAARKALTKAISTRSVWIYHVSSLCFPGLTLIAGFLTTERRRRFRQRLLPSTEETQEEGSKRGEGSIAITAVFVNENYRGRGVAESLVRTATRFYLVGEEAPPMPSPALSSAAKNKNLAKEAASSAGSTSSESSSIAPEASPILPSPPKEIFDYVSIYVDPKNESTCRVFSRVGYGLMDKEETGEIPIPVLRDALGEQYRIEWEKAGMSRRSSIVRDDGHDSEDEDVVTPGLPVPGSLPASEPPNNPTQGQDEGNEDSDHTPQGTAKFTSNIAEKPDPLDTVPIPVHSVDFVEGEGEKEVAIEQVQEAEEEESGSPEPCCRSVEDWEVVSLRSRTSEEGRRIRGSRREGEKRLSIDGPWQ